MARIVTPALFPVHNPPVTFRDVANDVELWKSEGEEIALATVVRTWGSGPRGPGAKMALTKDARISGSVSGGCVEAAVVEEGREVLATGEPRLLKFGIADETAWNVGLTCGGSIEIFVEKLDESLSRAFSESIENAKCARSRRGDSGRFRRGERSRFVKGNPRKPWSRRPRFARWSRASATYSRRRR